MGNYLEAILTERNWSWSILAIGYLAFTMVVRQIAFRHLVRELKSFNSGLYRATKRAYLKHSIGGWVFYLASVLLLIWAWEIREQSFHGVRLELLLLVSCIFFFLISLISHFINFARALVSALQSQTENQREL